MRILVTGATGTVGRHVVHRLIQSGHEVTSLSRPRADESVDPRLARATSELVGDAADEALLATAMRDVEAVIHLAAIPAPIGYGATDLLRANVLTTMAVFEAAAAADVRGVAYASSTSILGLVFGEDRSPTPRTLPISEDTPVQPADPYALGKEVDEAIARMAALRWGLASISLRLPYTGTADAIRARANDLGQRESLVRELWAYLDVRDASEAFERAVTRLVDGSLTGAHVAFVAADDVILPDTNFPELAAAAYPDACLRFASAGGFETTRARQLLGFRAQHIVHASTSETD